MGAGQSAIEYLMTYGWMLLVVAIVGGAIFSVVGDQAIENVAGFNSNEVQVTDFGTTESSLQMNLESLGPNSVEINQVRLSDSSNHVIIPVNNEISSGENMVLNLPNTKYNQNTEDIHVEITYDSGGLSNITTSGTITGSFGLDDSLVGYWPLDQNYQNQTHVYDISNNSNHGIKMSNPEVVEDPEKNYVFEFDGEDDKIELPNNPLYSSNQITVTGWFRAENLDDHGDYGYAAMIDHNDVMGSGGGSEGWGVGFRDERLRVDHGDGETAGSITVASYDYERWYFYWFTHDADAGESYSEMWARDDRNDEVTGEREEIDVNIQMNDQDLVIARGRQDPFPGRLSDIRLYNRVLSENEIESLYYHSGVIQ